MLGAKGAHMYEFSKVLLPLYKAYKVEHLLWPCMHDEVDLFWWRLSLLAYFFFRVSHQT